MKKIFIVIGIVMLITLYPVKNIFISNDFNSSEKIAFYGEYISFIGAFSLGYFIYRKDEMQRLNESKKQCKLLLYCIEKAEDDMMQLNTGIDLQQVYYDINWRAYYYEFEALTKGKYYSIRTTLDNYFNTIELINRNINGGERDVVEALIGILIGEREDSIEEYDILEVKYIISNLTLNVSFRYPIKGRYDKSTNAKINKYAVRYFSAIENYIYAYMMKNSIQNIEREVLNPELVEWLMKSNELRKFACNPYRVHKLHRLIFIVACMFNEKSDKLTFNKGEYNLR